MENKNRNKLYQLRTILLDIKNNSLAEPQAEDELKILFTLVKDYEKFSIETTLFCPSRRIVIRRIS